MVTILDAYTFFYAVIELIIVLLAEYVFSALNFLTCFIGFFTALIGLYLHADQLFKKNRSVCVNNLLS